MRQLCVYLVGLLGLGSVLLSCGEDAPPAATARAVTPSPELAGVPYVRYYRRSGKRMRPISREELAELKAANQPYCWINWTDGIAYAMEKGNVITIGRRQNLSNRNDMKFATLSILQRRVRGTLSLLISTINIDDRRTFDYFAKTQTDLSRWFQNYLNDSILHDIRYSDDGTRIRLIHKLYLYRRPQHDNALRDSFLRRVQKGYLERLFASLRLPPVNSRPWEDPYTALVIDVRHLPDFKPAVNTFIVDEAMRPIYPLPPTGKTEVERRHSYLDSGRVSYLRDPWQLIYLEEAGENPYYAYASGLAGQNRSRVVLTHRDCRRLLNRRAEAGGYSLLRKSRVFIIAR